MITIEKFFFDGKEATDDLIFNAELSKGEKGDYSFCFIATEDAPIFIEIKVRGREDFRKLITQMYEVGMALTEATNESEGTAQVGPVAGGAAQDPNTPI